MKKVILIALVCVMVVAVLAGCGGSAEQDNPIVGKWEDVSNGDINEFKSDGTYTVVDKDGNPKNEGENWAYKVEGDKLIAFIDGEQVDIDLIIKGDEILRDGEKVVLKRI